MCLNQIPFTLCTVPWDRVRVEVLLRVCLPEELHPEDGEDVDDNDEEEGEVSESAQRGDDDAQKDFHGRPGLGKLKDTHLEKDATCVREEISSKKPISKKTQFPSLNQQIL